MWGLVASTVVLIVGLPHGMPRLTTALPPSLLAIALITGATKARSRSACPPDKRVRSHSSLSSRRPLLTWAHTAIAALLLGPPSRLRAEALDLPATTLADLAGAETFRGGGAVLPRLGLPRVAWRSR